MSVPRPHYLAFPLATVTGGLLALCVLLAAKIYNPPPIDVLDASFWRLLGTESPVFELEGLHGEALSTRMFSGKAHLLVFGSSSCEACDSIYPLLKEHAQQIPVLMIVTGSREEIQRKARETGLSFPIAFDSLAVVAKSLDLRAYPTTMLINEEELIEKGGSGDMPSLQVMELATETAASKRRWF